MKYRELSLVCTCGKAATGDMKIGLTSEYELVVHWTCADCGQTVYAVKTLADCCRECPESEGEPANSPAADAAFLRSLGISA